MEECTVKRQKNTNLQKEVCLIFQGSSSEIAICLQLADKKDSGGGKGFSICVDDFKGVMRTFSATIHNLAL